MLVPPCFLTITSFRARPGVSPDDGISCANGDETRRDERTSEERRITSQHSSLSQAQHGARPEEPDPSSCREHPGRPAVVVRWNDDGDSAIAQSLALLVENTTATPQVVKLLLAGTTPSGSQTLEQAWTELLLQSKEARVLRVDFDEIPVQSSVAPAALRVLARYGQADGTPPALNALSFTESLLLTFDASFKTATARSVDQQSAHDAATDLNPVLGIEGEVRLRNAQTAAFVAMKRFSGPEEHRVIVRHVGEEEVHTAELAEPPVHFPDTEVLVGDAGPHFTGEDL